MYSMRILTPATAGLMALVALAACGGDSGPKTSTTITQTQAGAIGGLAESEVGSVVSGLSNFTGGYGNLTGGYFAPTTPSGRALATAARMAPAVLRPALSRMPADTACHPTVTGDTTDVDGDGVPLDLTVSFSAANCSYDDGQGNSVALTGAIRLQDTDDQTVLFGYRVDFTSWGVNVTQTTQQGTQTGSILVNGFQDGSVTGTNASAGENISYRARLNGSTVFTFASATNISYTPGTGTIDPGSQSRLQSGSFALSGSFSFNGSAQTNADGSWAFSLVSSTPLAYDETCSAESPFTGGQITGNITANQSAGFTIDYGPACGQTSITAYTSGLT